MSIILKGIDLPKRGTNITLTIKGIDGTYEVHGYPGDPEIHDQAIQIPKGHGRLIDGDELKMECYRTMDELLKSTTINISAEALSLLCGFTMISEAPTILESEEE